MRGPVSNPKVPWMGVFKAELSLILYGDKKIVHIKYFQLGHRESIAHNAAIKEKPSGLLNSSLKPQWTHRQLTSI